MYKVIAHRRALRFYRSLDKKTASRIDRVVEKLRKGPFSHRNIRKLRGEFAGSYRYRMGDIRIIYSVDTKKKVINIEVMEKRGKVY